jgi:hypothetical protein
MISVALSNTSKRILCCLLGSFCFFATALCHAVPTPLTLPSFRAMERVSRSIQKPAVDAIIDLHEDIATDVNQALEDLKETELSARGLAYQANIRPNFIPMLTDFTESPFGKAYLEARAERIRLTTERFTINGIEINDRPIELPSFPDPRELTASQLEVFNSLHQQFFTGLDSLLSAPDGVFSEASVQGLTQFALNNSNSFKEAENRLLQINTEIKQVEGIIRILGGVSGVGQGLLQSLAGLKNIDIKNIGQLTSVLESVGALRGGLSQLVGGDVGQILSQLGNFEGSLNSLMSTLTGGGLANILGLTQGINNLLGPLQSQLGSLTGQLQGLLNTQSLLNLVNIPFLSAAQGILSPVLNGLSLANIPGLANQILGKLGIGSLGLVQLIQQLFSASGAEAFVMNQFGSILGSFEPILGIMNSSLLGMIDSVLAETPLDIGDQLGNLLEGGFGNILNPENALLQLVWSGESLFTQTVQGGLQQLLNKINLPLSVNGFSVAALKESSPMTITPQAAALLTAASVSGRPVPKLVFGSKKRKATSKNFCSSLVSAKKKSACLTKANKDWVRYQAKLRTLSNLTASRLKSKKVIEQIERKAFGKKLSLIIAEAKKKAAAVTLPPKS